MPISKFYKKKIALTLAFATLFSAAQITSPQKVSGKAWDSNKIKKCAIIAGVSVVAVAAISTTLYFLLRNKKQVKSNEIDENKKQFKGKHDNRDNASEKEFLHQIEAQKRAMEELENESKNRKLCAKYMEAKANQEFIQKINDLKRKDYESEKELEDIRKCQNDAYQRKILEINENTEKDAKKHEEIMQRIKEESNRNIKTRQEDFYRKMKAQNEISRKELQKLERQGEENKERAKQERENNKKKFNNKMKECENNIDEIKRKGEAKINEIKQKSNEAIRKMEEEYKKENHERTKKNAEKQREFLENLDKSKVKHEEEMEKLNMYGQEVANLKKNLKIKKLNKH